MKTYKSDEKHDPVARFAEYFIDRARVPGVKTLGDFEKHFAAWIRELSALHFGGAETVDRLMERARKQRGNGALEYAKESYRWAIEKDPAFLPAHFELAQVLTDLEETDGALYHYRKVLKMARGRADPEMGLDGFDGMTADDMVLVCTALIEDLDSSFIRTLGKADEDFAGKAVELAKSYADQGMPRRAIRLVNEAAAMLGGHGPLEMLEEEIREASNADTRRWRRLPVWNGLAEWEHLAGAWSPTEEGVRIEGTHLCFTLCRENMPEQYRFQASIRMKEVKGPSGAGLVFGANFEKGLLMAGPFGHGDFLLSRLKEAPEVLEKVDFVHPRKLDEVLLAVEVRPGRAEFFVNGESIGSHRFGADEPSGRVGLFCQGCTAEFTDIKVRY
jgi:tetratricopeptide (TPR) repeat protein